MADKEKSYKVKDYIEFKVHIHELIVIRRGGYVVATCWVDQDGKCKPPKDVLNQTVKKESWGTLEIVNEKADALKMPCRFLDI